MGADTMAIDNRESYTAVRALGPSYAFARNSSHLRGGFFADSFRRCRSRVASASGSSDLRHRSPSRETDLGGARGFLQPRRYVLDALPNGVGWNVRPRLRPRGGLRLDRLQP